MLPSDDFRRVIGATSREKMHRVLRTQYALKLQMYCAPLSLTATAGTFTGKPPGCASGGQ
jgi:hypothetical protein